MIGGYCEMSKKYKLKIQIKKKIIMIISLISMIIVIIGGIYVYKNYIHTSNNNEDNLVFDENTGMMQSTNEPDRDYQILAIGNSALYSSFNPLQLWHEHGYTSFVMAAPKQNTKLSYHMLKEVLTVQKPQLLILETNAFFDDRVEIEDQGYTYTAIKRCYPLFMKSQRWNDIKSEKYIQDKSYKVRMELLKGYYFEKTVVPYTKGFSYMKASNEKTPFGTFTKQYLPKVLELAKEINCQVLLIGFPAQTSWDYLKYNTINEYAQKNNLPFIDFNVNQYDTKFDWKTDSRDGGNHLNYSGATKMTKYVGQYIHQHYNMKNHLNEKKYQQWNKDYNQFIQELVK